MMDDHDAIGLSSIAELNYLRLEAMDLFERCLTEGRTTFLEAFVEEQIARDPPRLDLLRDVAEDLHQRLLALREYHFDVMERTTRTLSDDFGLVVGAAIQAGSSEGAALLEPARVLSLVRDLNPNLSSRDETLVRRMLEMSAETAAQLREDIRMAEALFMYISDWVDGLSAVIARRFWNDGRNDEYSSAVQ